MRLDNIRNIYLIGDTHFGIRNNSLEWSNIQKSFFIDFFLKKIEKDFEPEHDILIFEGDIFHYRESVNVRIQNEVRDLFEILSKKFKRGVFAITGNHDIYYKDKREIHSLKPLSDLASNIHIFENPEVLSINGNHNFLMLPWIEDKKQMTSILSKYVKFCNYVICHTDIIGFNFNKWVKVEKGLKSEDFSDYTRIYSGHLHNRQSNKNILYTGTPYQMDRGDLGNIRGFYKIDVTSSELKEQFIKNTYSPQFIKMDLYDILEMSKLEISKTFDNNFIDVLIDISFANKITIPIFLDLISDSNHRTLEFFTYSKNKTNVSNTIEIKDSFDLTEIFKIYLKEKEYDIDIKEKVINEFLLIKKQILEER